MWMTRKQHELGVKTGEENAAQRSCSKCRAAGRHKEALGHKGSNCPFDIVYVSDDEDGSE
jgi:hypothetical protein